MELFKQITQGRTPEQMDAFYKKAEEMGVPSDLINQIRYPH